MKSYPDKVYFYHLLSGQLECLRGSFFDLLYYHIYMYMLLVIVILTECVHTGL